MNATLATPRGVTAAFASAGLAEGTNAGTFKIEAPNGAGVDYAIEGLGYHKAEADNLAFSAGHDVQADDTACLYLVQLNSAGTVSTKQGEAVSVSDLAEGKKSLQWPEPDADKCPIGAIKVVNDGGTFTPGTTDLGAATVTDTYYNFVGGMPSAPITS